MVMDQTVLLFLFLRRFFWFRRRLRRIKLLYLNDATSRSVLQIFAALCSADDG